MYDLLVAASERTPIVDNEQGSLVTMSSLQALLFGYVINTSGKTFVRASNIHYVLLFLK
jgi:hypothetical protein